MEIDVLIFEIGSTTTVVNAFDGIYRNEPRFIGQGKAETSVLAGDVTIGLNEAIEDLKSNLSVHDIKYKEIFATSSAAGGLKMTVHGLVYDMTVKAAQNAALGAGANIHFITSGKLTAYDLTNIKKIQPNIILLAGGVDFGEKATALNNAYEIAKLQLNVPVIYAGNCAIQPEIEGIFREYGQDAYLTITENVYPKIDELNIEPTRKIIQEVFEKHIIHAKGMEKIRDIINGHIIPTPGAVMQAAQLLEGVLSDLVVFDVGGATTDLHSVTNGSEDVSRILISPEPKAKRTVEGDLGLYVNHRNLVNIIGKDKLCEDLKISQEELDEILSNYEAIPSSRQIPLVERLTKEALKIALDRHTGKYRSLYGAEGRMKVAEGKDLTNVKYIVGTGGALTRLPNREAIIKAIIMNPDPLKLMPPKQAQILIDNDYIMASIGVLSLKYPNQALKLIMNSIGLGGEDVSTD
ncbi:MAG TPA: GlmL-related ornithine degradation protein [Haloplasmataceae bacterium]